MRAYILPWTCRRPARGLNKKHHNPKRLNMTSRAPAGRRLAPDWPALYTLSLAAGSQLLVLDHDNVVAKHRLERVRVDGRLLRHLPPARRPSARAPRQVEPTPGCRAPPSKRPCPGTGPPAPPPSSCPLVEKSTPRQLGRPATDCSPLPATVLAPWSTPYHASAGQPAEVALPAVLAAQP